jgi:general secretion pathway protein G
MRNEASEVAMQSCNDIIVRKRCSKDKAGCAQERGFTLLEVMVVLVLIALIASTIGVAVWKKFIGGQVKAAQLQVREIVGDVEQFMIMKGKCPTVDDLVHEHLLKREPRDPWGGPIVIRCPGDHEHDPADVVSSGPDQKPDTNDDIRSWEL